MTTPPTLSSGEVLDVIWDHSTIGLAKVSREGTFLKVNDRLCEMLEYSRSELSSKTFQDITHPADLKDDLEMVRACLAGDIDSYTMTKRYLTKTGKVLWIKLKVTTLRSSGEFCFFIAQITPAILPTAATEPAKKSPLEKNIKTFLKTNWKWVLGGIVSFIVGTYEFYHVWKTTQETIVQQSEQIKNLTGLLEKMEPK